VSTAPDPEGRGALAAEYHRLQDALEAADRAGDQAAAAEAWRAFRAFMAEHRFGEEIPVDEDGEPL
jgi:hypothetical protein